ncbi:MAG: hypothetical protein J6J42_05420 [Lachnospiraceae bacterium]|nr:hypothetical protein [Lachnospiraceae bacterium]
MPQKLSAMRYIKNNKRRTSVLIVSLCLSFVLTYLTQFLLSTNSETFRTLFEYSPKKIQFVSLAGSSYGLDVDNLSTEELMPLYQAKRLELMEHLREQEGVKKVYYAEVLYGFVQPLVGGLNFEIPLIAKEELPVLLDHFGATLVEGRLPEQPGELVLDRDTVRNNDQYSLNGSFYTGTDLFQIVGIVDCDSYFGCGIPHPELPRTTMITILSEGIDDFGAILAEYGITVRENFDTIVDYQTCHQIYETEVLGSLRDSTTFIYLGIILLLSISLFIVYTTYLRDRRDEWCLYCSIGYSRQTIYFSILRELLFTFVTALLLGTVIIGISEFLLYLLMIAPAGLKCRFFSPQAVFEILSSYVLLFGLLQLPVRTALWKIRTIDAIEDDLY